jgi:hypothetical protein
MHAHLLALLDIMAIATGTTALPFATPIFRVIRHEQEGQNLTRMKTHKLVEPKTGTFAS